MKPVTVGRYNRKDLVHTHANDVEGPVTGPPGYENPWLGWIETEDWIVYQHEDGSLHCFHGRDPETGAVNASASSVVLKPGGQIIVPEGMGYRFEQDPTMQAQNR